MANCRPNIPDFTSPECDFEAGRIVALAFIHKDIHAAIFANPSNAALWIDGNYSADLHVFTEVRETLTASPVEVPGLGTQSSRIINAERTIECSIEGVKNNESFFDEIVKSHEYRVAAVIGSLYDMLFINNKDVSIWGTPNVEEGLDTQVLWAVTIKWFDVANMKTSDVPAGIFN